MDKKILMKRSLSLILIIAVLACFLTPVSFTHAQAGPGAAIGMALAGVCASVSCWIKSAFDKIAQIILTILAFFLGFAGRFLNWILSYTIIDMKIHVGDLKGINTAWEVVRNIMNIFFIFLLVYEGVKLIINQSSTDNIKKFITGVVLASLLVNFSLFFTKVIIDASNVVTIGFYQSILKGNTKNDPNYGLSDPIMNALKLTSIYNGDAADSFAQGSADYLVNTLGGALVILIATFVFFAISIVFVIRYLVLIILLMLSPIAYMGLGLPFMQTYAKQWWSAFNSQILFAPIYMMITWVILTLMASPGFLSGSNYTTVFSKSPSGWDLVLNFGVIIGLLIASLVIAKNTSSHGNQLIGKATGNLTAFAGGAVMGGTAWAGRNTIGRFGASRASSAQLQEDASTKTGLRGAWARTKLYTARTARDATFDVRNAAIPTNALGSVIEGTLGRTRIGKSIGLNEVNIPSIAVGSRISGIAGTGEGGKKGYRELSEEKAKRIREREKTDASELRQAQNESDIKNGAKPGATTAEIEAMEKALSKLSDKETETLVASNRELLKSQEFANTISVKQLEAINKSDQFSEQEKDELKNRRFEEIKTIYNPAAMAAYTAATAVPVAARTPAQVADIKRMEDARSRVKGLSDSELEMIDVNYLDPSRPEGREFISQLKASQVETITTNKSGKFTTTQKNNIRDERMRPLKDALAAGSTPDIQREIRKADYKALVRYMKTPGRAGTNIALDLDVLPLYTPQTLKRMASHDDMTDTDIDTLRTALLAHGSAATQAWLTNPDKGMIDFPAI